MRLFRQSQRGVWHDVADAMARGLSGMLGPRTGSRMIMAPCSIGELIDKITILRIKTQRIDDESKLRNVHRELALLEDIALREGLVGSAIESLTDAFAAANARLWDIEDAIRVCERTGDFGARFVSLARSVYIDNDERAGLKRAVNATFASAIAEEKATPEKLTWECHSSVHVARSDPRVSTRSPARALAVGCR
jgi:hypothetical protein